MTTPAFNPRLAITDPQVWREDQNVVFLDNPYLDGPPVKLSPSLLSFLPDCDSCIFYDYYSVKHPRGIFPRIFNDIDGLNKEFFTGKDTREISPELPPGKLGGGDMFIQSEVIYIPGHRPFYMTGKLDMLATFEGDAGFGVIDFKTANPKADHLQHYTRQLGAYALILDRPATNRQRFFPVNFLGLLCLMPSQMCQSPTGKIGYLVEPTYVPLQRDDDALLHFIANRVLRVLELPTQPEPSPSCEWCCYRDAVLSGI